MTWLPPITQPQITDDLRALGVREGDQLLVHTSLRSLSGPHSMVVGGAVAVVGALVQAVGATGTVVMPTFSSDLSEPSLWTHPPAPQAWWETIRRNLPVWRPDAIPTRGVGVVPEIFRKMDGVLRSDHPQASFAARGARATDLLVPHPLDDGLGRGSPLGRLATHRGRALLIGCSWRSCTTFHLGEIRAGAPTVRQGAPLLREGRRVWTEWTEPRVSTRGFAELGEAFEASAAVVLGRVGRATARLFDIEAAARFAAEHIGRYRSG